MSRRVSENTPQKKAGQGVWGVEDLRKRPAPATGGVPVQLYIAQSTTNVAASWTTLDWVDSGESDAFDTNLFSINGAGNIAIAGQGAYTFDLYSGTWVYSPLVSSEIGFVVNAISGSLGIWGSRISSGEIVSQTIGRVNDASDVIDAAQTMGPDLHGVALWQASDTFPVEIEVQVAKFENGTLTADANPNFRLAITRWGSAYET